MLYCCWLLVGQRYYVVVGSGRKRLNILGAYSPDDHDYVDLRLTTENITGERFISLLEKLLAQHPDTEKFILYLDNARYYSKPLVKEWLARHRQGLLSIVVDGRISGGGLLPHTVDEDGPLDDLGQERRTIQRTPFL